MIAQVETPPSTPIDPQPASAGQAQPVPQVSSRLLFVDSLRVALTILVVMHHLAVTYGASAPWYYIEVPQDGGLSYILLLLFVLFNQAFFMGCFFLIAGYFTPPSYDRKGAAAFLKDRLLRLGLPLLVFTVLLGPITAAIGYSSIAPLIGATTRPAFWELYVNSLGPGPLWFVEALLIFACGYASWRWLTRDRVASTNQASPLPTYRAVIAFTLALAVATFIVRIWMPIGWSLPVLAFPTPGHLPQYVGLFAAGTIANRRGWLLSIPDRMGKIGFGAAILASLVLFPLGFFLGVSPEQGTSTFNGGLHWQAFVYGLWEAIFSVGMCLGLLTFFRKRFNRQGALGAFLSTHAYTVYIIHALVIVVLAYGLAPVLIHPLLKFALAVILGVPLCFSVAYLVRKLPFAQRVL